MTKSGDANRKPETHFEQVPLEEVKKFADPDVYEETGPGVDTLEIEPTSMKTEPYSMRLDSLPEKGRGN